MAQAGSGRRLSGAEITLIVVVAALVLVFLVMLAQRLVPGNSPGEAQTPTDDVTQSAPGDDATEDEEPGVGEDLSALDYSFVTPSGNIACAMSPDRVVCAIASFEYSVPGNVAEECTGNAGHFLAVTADTSELLCDTSGTSPTIDPGDAEELAYGASMERGSFRCVSEETGVTCAHTDTGRSISVARAAYSLG